MNTHSSEQRIRKNRIRRKRELRKHITLSVVACCLIVILSISMSSFLSTAHGFDTSDISYKYYNSIIIHPGDSLWSIAESYVDSHYDSIEAYVKEVMNINHLTDDTIQAGSYLIIPYYSDEFVG